MAIGTYCGTSDLRMVSHDYTDIMGTDFADFINSASDWIEAEFYGHNMTPPPVSPVDGNYDYWLRRACACRAYYVAADSMLTERTDNPDGGWWIRYEQEAEEILADIRSGAKKLTYQSSIWQNPISEAVPWVNGTTAPAVPNMLHTNGKTGGRYTSDRPRIFEIQLDGSTGTNLSDFTYRYRIAGGSVYMGSGQPVDLDSWVLLGWGVYILWTPTPYGTPAVDQTWRIYCTPLGENVTTGGARHTRRNWA